MDMDHLGFQSDQVAKAIELLKSARARGDKIAISFTGNVISSGLRKYICELVKRNIVSSITTSGSGVEEDIIKSFGDYDSVEFMSDSRDLIARKLCRIGNLAVSESLYAALDDFLSNNYHDAFCSEFCDQTPGSIAKILAQKIGDDNSFLYWAHKNNIDVFCPTFHDGAIGDFLTKFRKKNPQHRIDYIYENIKLSDSLACMPKCGVIIVGGGTSKHFTLNCSIPRGGFDWGVIVSTAIPYDGSDSGGDCEEAKTWGKFKVSANNVSIYSEATLVFPTLVEDGLLYAI
jgi:deoxyhypusine synthase